MPCSADALHGMLRYDRPMTFSGDEDFARQLDPEDPLKTWWRRHISPRNRDIFSKFIHFCRKKG
jgi:hypothetical protein